MSGLANDHVYITDSNAKRIIFALDVRAYRDLNYSVYTSDLSHILSPPELARIAVLQELFSSRGEGFTVNPKARHHNPEDYALSAKSPAFHATSTCPLISSTYKNLLVPPEIKAKGNAEVQRFKDFCEENRSLYSSNEEYFFLRLRAAFRLKNIPKKIEVGSTGLYRDEASFDSLVTAIDDLLVSALEFRERDSVTASEIAAYGKRTHSHTERDKKGTVINIWHYKYKLELKKLLEEYSRLKYNSLNAFSPVMLMKLHFSGCNRCLYSDSANDSDRS